MNFENLMDNIPGAFYRCSCDKDWTMRHMSAGIEQLTGYMPDDILYNSVVAFASLIHPEEADFVEREVMQAVENHTAWDVEYRLRDRNNTYRWVSEQGVGIYDTYGQVLYLDGFVADISERRAIQEALRHSEEKVRRLAYYDSVTGLPNRNLIFQQINTRLQSLELSHVPFSLLFLDLDGFKPINDRFGHASGDLVLKASGQRVRQMLQSDDVVARIGGDEFLVFINDAERTNTQLLAENIIQNVAAPITLNEQNLKPQELASSGGNEQTKTVAKITASAGIAYFPEHGKTLDRILAAADEAMYEAKAKGKNTIQVYTPDDSSPFQKVA